MKRLGNLYDRICSTDNLRLADTRARRHKKHQYGVQLFDRNKEANIQALHTALVDRTYKTSAYDTFSIFEPKERLVYRLPYYPDRITHHAIMNVLERMFVAMFTADTYSCIKGRGIHGAQRALKRALRNEAGTRYFLKLDIRKFYPSVDHDILKAQLRRKIKDADLLWLLDEIIDSAPGLPIGNYLSQYLANFFLTPLDHWLKEVMGVKNCFRYADDVVILAADKESLHRLRGAIDAYLRDNLKLDMKDNWRIAPVDAQGIDFVGYVFRHSFILMRKGIKQNFARKIASGKNPRSFASYYGWAKHCNSRHLLNKLSTKNLLVSR